MYKYRIITKHYNDENEVLYKALSLCQKKKKKIKLYSCFTVVVLLLIRVSIENEKIIYIWISICV